MYLAPGTSGKTTACRVVLQEITASRPVSEKTASHRAHRQRDHEGLMESRIFMQT